MVLFMHKVSHRGKHELLADYLNRYDFYGGSNMRTAPGKHEFRRIRVTGEFSHFSPVPAQANITYSGVDAITEDDVWRKARMPIPNLP